MNSEELLKAEYNISNAVWKILKKHHGIWANGTDGQWNELVAECGKLYHTEGDEALKHLARTASNMLMEYFRDRTNQKG